MPYRGFQRQAGCCDRSYLVDWEDCYKVPSLLCLCSLQLFEVFEYSIPFSLEYCYKTWKVMIAIESLKSVLNLLVQLSQNSLIFLGKNCTFLLP